MGLIKEGQLCIRDASIRRSLGRLLFADRIELRPVFNADFSAAAHGMESPN